MLAPEPRLPEARALIEQRRFLGVHAPRQTGKTTTLAALAADLTAEGRFAAVRFSCETARTAPDDGIAEDRILGAIRLAARSTLTPELQPPARWPDATPGSRLRDGLSAWAGQCPLPLVLFFDEIDAALGNALLNVLSQLRDGYTARDQTPFPASAVLCGLRDVRDYRVAAGADPDRIGRLTSRSGTREDSPGWSTRSRGRSPGRCGCRSRSRSRPRTWTRRKSG
jgi:hypothetical protein